MKQILIYSLIACVVFAVGCRKKEYLERRVTTKPLHCYNSIQDEDETGVDEGGGCTQIIDWEFIYSSCSQATNTATFIYYNGNPTHSANVGSCTKKISGSYYIFTITLDDGGVIELKTHVTVPYNTLLKKETSAMGYDEYSATVKYPGSSAYVIYEGNIQLKRNDHYLGIDICGGNYGLATVTTFALVN